MPSCAVRYKIELLCQLPKPHFEANVPFGDILSFLVRRLFVANFCASLLTGYRVITYMGCFLDGTGILMITLPVFLPITHALGIDLVWFGILFTINLEMGMLTPPFGGNLFYMRAVVPKETATMVDIYIAMVPFILIQVLVIALLIFLPEIALWLPRLMVGGGGRMGEF